MELNVSFRSILITTLPDTRFDQRVIYRIPDSSKFKHKSYGMKWEYYIVKCSLQLKFKQNMYVFPLT